MTMAFRTVLKDGYLKKVYESKKLLKRPAQRWYILVLVNNQPILESYNSREASLTEGPLHTFNLSHCPPVAPQMAASERSRFVFVIVLPGDKRLSLQASQAAEMEGWLARLNHVINRFGQQARQDNTYGGCDEYGELSFEDIYADGELGATAAVGGGKGHQDEMDDIAIAKAKSASAMTSATHNGAVASPLGACGGPAMDGSQCSTDSGSGDARQSHPLPALPSEPTAQFPVPKPRRRCRTDSSGRKASRESPTAALTDVQREWNNNPFIFSDAAAPPVPPPTNATAESSVRPRPIVTGLPPPNLPIPPLPPGYFEEEDVYGHAWDNGATSASGAVPQTSGNGKSGTDTAVPHSLVKSWVRELDSITDRITNVDLWLREVGVAEGTPVDELNEDVYGRLEANLEAKGEWENLTELRTRRNQSVTNVFKPNPKAPDFDSRQPPLQLAGFFDKKVGLRSVGETVDHRSVKEGMLTVRRDSSGTAQGTALFITAGPDATLSALTGAVEALKRQILSPGGVVATVRVADLRQHVAFVEVNNAVWIAGWHPKTIRLHKLIHIGDEVVGINDMCPCVDSVKTLNKLLDSLPQDEERCQLRLRRLPHGKVLAIRRDVTDQSLGIVRVGGTNEIAKIPADSVTARHGLPETCANYDPPTAGASEGHWCLTEVNGRPLNMFYKNNEADVALGALGVEISLVVQPADLVKRIRKAVKAVRRFKGFVGQA